MAVQTLPQPVLDGNIGGLLGLQFHHQQLEVIDAAAVINDQLHPLIAAIHGRPNQQARIHHQVIGQAPIALGKDHRLTGAREVFQLQHRHPIPLTGVHRAQLRHHHHRAHLGLVWLLLQLAQGNG